MRSVLPCSLFALLLVLMCTGCSHKKVSPPAQAQAPPLQTGKGTLNPPQTAQQQEKATSPLASPLPPPSAQSVPLPPPSPKKVRHRAKTTPKPVDNAQAAPAAPAAAPTQPPPSNPPSSAQVVPPQAAGSEHVGTPSPIGQLTTGDSAMEERTKRATVDLIGETQQGLASLKRALSNEEKVTAVQIHTFLNQAQQALDNGDTDGAHGLATKAKQLLDELTKP